MAYSFKKTCWKGAGVLVEIVLAGIIVYLTDNNYYIALVPVLEMIRNWYKHKD